MNMFPCNFANYDDFLKEFGEKFSNCKYTFYKNKCISIVSDLFHLGNINDKDTQFLEKQSGYSIDDWKTFISDFRHEAELREEELFQEQPMDPNNMPIAP